VKTWATAKIANNKVLEIAASLLRVDAAQLAAVLTTRFDGLSFPLDISHRRNCIKGEWFTVPLDLAAASDSRDALAKSLYGQVFNWLVDRINKTIFDDASRLFIGLLDIFGFEQFQVS
jgi:myosin heavy subunit